MYIAHKSNVLQNYHQEEWRCRRLVKGMTKSEYWAWIETITSGDPPTVDYSGETGYTIVECTDEDVQARLAQLDEYINHNRLPGEALVYNIKYYVTKRDSEILIAENVEDEDGNPVAKVYLQSHFVPQDDARDARLLADEWTRIRAERTRLLGETDWMALSDTETISTAWKNYRKSLRDLPSEQSSKTTYADITWPSKP